MCFDCGAGGLPGLTGNYGAGALRDLCGTRRIAIDCHGIHGGGVPIGADPAAGGGGNAPAARALPQPPPPYQPLWVSRSVACARPLWHL
jgi:hypothetical protein